MSVTHRQANSSQEKDLMLKWNFIWTDTLGLGKDSERVTEKVMEMVTDLEKVKEMEMEMEMVKGKVTEKVKEMEMEMETEMGKVTEKVKVKEDQRGIHWNLQRSKLHRCRTK